MKAHDVRKLRHCAKCDRLVHQDNFTTDQICIGCAWRKARTVDRFLTLYPWQDADKLSIGLIGGDNMRHLIERRQFARAAR
jgi:hypothetical protein